MNSADPTQVPTRPYKKKPSKRLSVALLLILGPTVMIALAFILYASINFASTSTPVTLPTECQGRYDNALVSADEQCTDQLFGTQPAALTAANVVLFGLGTIGVLTWLPGLIIGAILIAKRPKDPSGPAL